MPDWARRYIPVCAASEDKASVRSKGWVDFVNNVALVTGSSRDVKSGCPHWQALRLKVFAILQLKLWGRV